jgi:hypothetical protein
MNKQHNYASVIARWLSEMRDAENINVNVQQVAVNLKDKKAERLSSSSSAKMGVDSTLPKQAQLSRP